MITLHGTPISNYYNKVKLALIEKGIAFSEAPAGTPGVGITDEAQFAASPLGKIPFIRVDGQALCESQVIVDYLEARWPTPPLVPADAFAAAKVRELATFVDLHIELVARELYASAFFGGAPLDDAAKDASARSWSSTSPASSSWRALHPTPRGTASRSPTARPGPACRWW